MLDTRKDGGSNLRKDYYNLNEKVRVAIYARVSTEHEAQISALENQIQYYEGVLKEHPNWILEERYIDKGISGTSILKRDAFMQMIRDAHDGKFDLIITREVSRFARNTADALVQVRELINKDVAVFFIEDGIFASLFSHDEWEVKLGLMGTLAQNESKKISSRVKAGQKISFENGVFYGNGNILGYDRVGKDMVINKEQAETVRRIFDLYLRGNGIRKIQFILEQEERKTATGLTRWSAQVIAKVLKNSFYCGIIVYRKQFVPDYLIQKKVNNHGQVEKITVKGTHEPIITEEEFEQVQKLMQGKIRTTKDGKKVGHGIPHDIFCRKIVCDCGCTFNKRRGYTTKNNEQRYLYQCYSQLRSGTVTTRKKKGLDTSNCCDSMTLPNWKLEVTADWLFRRFFDNKQFIYERTMELLEEALNASSSVSDVTDEIKEYEKKIDSLNEKYSRIVDLYFEGNVSKDIYLSKKNQIEETIEKYENTIDTLKERLVQVQDENNVLERKKAIADFLLVKAFKEDAPIPEELIEYYVESIQVDNEKMTWILRIPDGTDFDNVLNVQSKKKEKNNKVTPHKNYECCTSQDRLRSTTNKIYS